MHLDKQCSLIHLYFIAHSMAPMMKRLALIGHRTLGNLIVCAVLSSPTYTYSILTCSDVLKC